MLQLWLSQILQHQSHIWPWMEIIDLFLQSCCIIQDDQYKVTFVGRYQDNLTRWRWQAFCWWCLPPRLQGRASSQIGARTRELQPTTCLKYKIMKMQIKSRQSFPEEPEPVEMSSKLTTSGAMNSGVSGKVLNLDTFSLKEAGPFNILSCAGN